jgi:hypothetical protein
MHLPRVPALYLDLTRSGKNGRRVVSGEIKYAACARHILLNETRNHNAFWRADEMSSKLHFRYSRSVYACPAPMGSKATARRESQAVRHSDLKRAFLRKFADVADASLDKLEYPLWCGGTGRPIDIDVAVAAGLHLVSNDLAFRACIF